MSIVITSSRTDPRAILLGGGTVNAIFEAHETAGPINGRATYFLADEEPYTFADGTREASLENVQLSTADRSFSKELSIVREEGGGRRMRLDLLLLVEEVPASGNEAEAFLVLSFARTLGAEIRALLNDHSRQEVREMLDVSDSTLRRMEKDDHIPSAATLKKLPKSMDEAKTMMS